MTPTFSATGATPAAAAVAAAVAVFHDVGVHVHVLCYFFAFLEAQVLEIVLQKAFAFCLFPSTNAIDIVPLVQIWKSSSVRPEELVKR